MPMQQHSPAVWSVAVLAALAVGPVRAHDRVNTDAGDAHHAVIDSANRFGLELYRLLAEQREDNLFLSPYSVYTALAMTLEGARGETAEQMRTVLHAPAPAGPGPEGEGSVNPDLHAALGALQARFNADDRPYELHVANALWGEQTMPFRDAFTRTLDQHYGAGLFPVDFVNHPEPSRLRINEWVERQTNGRIEDLLPQDVIDELTRLVLTNAIYFKAAWADPFRESWTKLRPFQLGDGTSVEVPTMRHGEVRVRLHRGETWTAVEVPYEQNELAMLILMPKRANGLAKLVGTLDADRLAQIVGELKPGFAELEMPRFKVESSFGLKEVLKRLGMERPFEHDRADFSGISESTEPLYISHVMHKAFVDVNEEGTEAAAATGVVISTTALRQTTPVRIDRPFLFLIRDTRTGTVVFLGQLTDPR